MANDQIKISHKYIKICNFWIYYQKKKTLPLSDQGLAANTSVRTISESNVLHNILSQSANLPHCCHGNYCPPHSVCNALPESAGESLRIRAMILEHAKSRGQLVSDINKLSSMHYNFFGILSALKRLLSRIMLLNMSSSKTACLWWYLTKIESFIAGLVKNSTLRAAHNIFLKTLVFAIYAKYLCLPHHAFSNSTW